MAEANPYVGPRPFQPGDRGRFFGRAGEVNQLVSLVYAHRLTVLYAESGAGKTSLLNAGVIPELEEDEGFQVLRSTRVSGIDAARADEAKVANIHSYNAISGWLDEDEFPDPSESVVSFLAKLDHLADEAGDSAPRIIVFDQFEEVFTSYPERWKERDAFFHQLREAMDADPMLRVVLSLREDYLASLEPHLELFFGLSMLRFRLERLREAQALAAVTDPLKPTTRRFAKGVAEGLVEDLMEVRVERADQAVPVITSGEYAEPVQLQVVCARLWDRLPDDVSEISKTTLKDFGDIDEALTDFYDEAVQRAIDADGIKEPRLRDWFEHTLVTSAGTRSTVYQDNVEGTTGGLPNTVVEVLEDSHVIRGETRRGSRWFELTHDRFIEPMRESNLAFRRERRKRRNRRTLVGGGVVVAASLAGAGFTVAQSEPAEPQTITQTVVARLDAITVSSGTQVDDVPITAGQLERYRITANKGEAITITLTSSDLDAVGVRLASIDENEQVVTQLGSAEAVFDRDQAEKMRGRGPTDADARTASATLVRGIPETGDYAIEVTADRSGSFTLAIDLGPDDRPRISEAKPGTGVIADSEAVQEWILEDVAGGELISISLRPALFLDAVLTLTNAAIGVELAAVDNGGDAERETLLAQVPASGELVLTVSGFERSVGIYDLQLDRIDASPLTNGLRIDDSIDEPGDFETFIFEGSEGDFVGLDLTPEDRSLFDGVLVAYSLQGEQLARADSHADGESERITLRLPADGAYLVGVEGYQGSVGSFSLALSQNSSIPSIDLDETTSRQLDAPEDQDVIQFDAATGDVLQIIVEPDAGLVADIEVVGPAGFRAFGFGLPGERTSIPIVSQVDGTYLVSVIAFDGSGLYDLTAARASVEPARLGETQSGEFGPERQDDFYVFEAVAGRAVRIEAAADGDLLVSMGVYRADTGEFLTFGDSTSPVEMEVLRSGEYLVAADNSLGGSGSYDLTISDMSPFEIDLAALFGGDFDVGLTDDLGVLQPGVAVSGSLSLGETYFSYLLDGEAGQDIEIRLEPTGDLDGQLALYDADFNELVFEDAGFDGDPETISITLPADGEYIVEVYEFVPGAATDGGFILTSGEPGDLGEAGDAPDQGESLQEGDSVSGALPESGESVLYVYAGLAGESILVTVDPNGDLDPVVVLYDANFNELDYIDFGGNGDSEAFVFELPADGEYILEVFEFAPGAATDFEFTVLVEAG